jgi:hypothetical protein
MADNTKNNEGNKEAVLLSTATSTNLNFIKTDDNNDTTGLKATITTKTTTTLANAATTAIAPTTRTTASIIFKNGYTEEEEEGFDDDDNTNNDLNVCNNGSTTANLSNFSNKRSNSDEPHHQPILNGAISSLTHGRSFNSQTFDEHTKSKSLLYLPSELSKNTSHQFYSQQHGDAQKQNINNNNCALAKANFSGDQSAAKFSNQAFASSDGYSTANSTPTSGSSSSFNWSNSCFNYSTSINTGSNGYPLTPINTITPAIQHAQTYSKAINQHTYESSGGLLFENYANTSPQKYTIATNNDLNAISQQQTQYQPVNIKYGNNYSSFQQQQQQQQHSFANKAYISMNNTMVAPSTADQLNYIGNGQQPLNGDRPSAFFRSISSNTSTNNPYVSNALDSLNSQYQITGNAYVYPQVNSYNVYPAESSRDNKESMMPSAPTMTIQQQQQSNAQLIGNSLSSEQANQLYMGDPNGISRSQMHTQQQMMPQASYNYSPVLNANANTVNTAPYVGLKSDAYLSAAASLLQAPSANNENAFCVTHSFSFPNPGCASSTSENILKANNLNIDCNREGTAGVVATGTIESKSQGKPDNSKANKKTRQQGGSKRRSSSSLNAAAAKKNSASDRAGYSLSFRINAANESELGMNDYACESAMAFSSRQSAGEHKDSEESSNSNKQDDENYKDSEEEEEDSDVDDDEDEDEDEDDDDDDESDTAESSLKPKNQVNHTAPWMMKAGKHVLKRTELNEIRRLKILK